MSVDPWATQLHPPASYSPWWWVVVAACLIGIVAVIWWARRALRASGPNSWGDDLLERLRAETLTRIDRIEAAVDGGVTTPADGATRLSGEVRRFVGTVTNGDADYRVLPELRGRAVKDPRFDGVVALVTEAEQLAFEPAREGAVLTPLLERSREVVRQWT
ncbi:hypothetical protein [Nocardioides alcanivorans]|uniref:hypothetical protein n=1 Tax=Nocardioides alcanivorans TaxID=2897352 RepID=UPI001F16C400|nr:hypothetical protein [Nocardioides alcanivorans]